MSLLNVISFITSHPLNQGQALRSVVRFAKWQVGSRLVPGEVVYDWVNGSRFYVKNGEAGLTGNIYTGLHEFSDMAFLLHFLREDDLFVDVGANVGSYTILACSAIGARGIAFEPIPATFNRLQDNLRLNRLEDRTKAINKGVGAERGQIAFTSDSDTMNHALASDEQRTNTVTVEVTSLDETLRNESPALMKIDVEGFEAPVIEGASETLQKPSLQSVIMELNGSGGRYGFDESRILASMVDYGFGTYSYDPFNRTLISLDGKNLESGNTLFVRDRELVEQRLRNSPKIKLHGYEF